MIPIEPIARAAYHRYCESKDGKGIHDRPLRKWDALLPSTRTAWICACVTAIELHKMHEATLAAPQHKPLSVGFVPDIDLAAYHDDECPGCIDAKREAEERAILAERRDT